jgi:glycosyltransferase involved in cell wall biosynthesis
LKEFVIIDGGSKPDLLSSFESYLKQGAKFISEPDKGIYDAMNKGIRIATGEWLIFMNIGDRFQDPNVLTKMMDSIKGRKGDLVCGDILRDGKERISNPNKFMKGYLCYHSICHQSILARRIVFDSIGTFDTSFRLVADRDWIYRAIDAGFKYVHLPIVVCDWEIGGACFDHTIEENELSRYRLINFSIYKRVLYGYLYIGEKIYKRIMSRNFKTPVALKKSSYFLKS